MPNPETYSKTTDFSGGDIDGPVLNAAILADAGITTNLISTSFDGIDTVSILFDSQISAGEKTALDAIVAAHALTATKKAKFAAIDDRTRELIAEGFTHLGKVFSQSTNAQLACGTMGAMIGNSLLVEPDDFPIVLNTIDDLDTISLPDIAAAKAFFDSMGTSSRLHIASGTSLKDDVRAAGTVAAVQAITDSR